MESKTLNTIQTISKVGKVLSAVTFVCCLVSGICCVVGAACVGIPGTLRIGGVTIHSIVADIEGVSVGTAYTAMLMGSIFCAAGCVVSKLAERYFENELAAGTPFTVEGSRELLRLGICTIAVPLGAIVLAEILYKVASIRFAGVADMHVGGDISIGLGLAIIVLSLVCKYGAEQASSAGQGWQGSERPTA